MSRPTSTNRGKGPQTVVRWSPDEHAYAVAAVGEASALASLARQLVLDHLGWVGEPMPPVHLVPDHRRRVAACGYRGGSRTKVPSAVTCPECLAKMGAALRDSAQNGARRR